MKNFDPFLWITAPIIDAVSSIVRGNIFHDFHSMRDIIFDQRDAFRGTELRSRLVQNVRDALMTTGFVGFTGLRFLSPDLLYRAKEKGNQLFALSDTEKEALVRPELGKQRGMTLSYGETAVGALAGDNKEFWHMGRVYAPTDPMSLDCGTNVAVPSVPGFDETMAELYAAFDAELDLTLELFSEALGLPTRYLSDLSAGGDDVLRDLHYLPFTGNAPEHADWGGAHTDIDFVSGLASDDENGLELQMLNGTWIPVRIPKDGFMVNVGDMLQGMTGGRFRSTVHRVRRQEDPSKHRRSTVYFKHPRRERMLEMLALNETVFGAVTIPWETVCEGYALFDRLIENHQYIGVNPYTKTGRDPSVPPLVQR